VSTPIGSIEDVVVHDRTGFIVPVGDTAAVRSALVRLRGDAALRSDMGAAARAHCRARFDIDVVGSQWLDVLSRAAKR
jgi:glycosyltransferase involved in cell wall biosynthesis